MKLSLRRRGLVPVLVLLLVGMVYLAYLLSLPSDGVFFSGDAGLKYLLSKQFIEGHISPVLVLPNSHLTPQDNFNKMNGTRWAANGNVILQRIKNQTQRVNP